MPIPTIRTLALRSVTCVLATSAALLLTATAGAQAPGRDAPAKTLEPVPVETGGLLPLNVTLRGSAPGGADLLGTCPPTVITYSDADFAGGSFILQAGFVADEVAAVSFTIDPTEFPITIDTVEMIFAQQNAVVTTTTEWSFLVWEGTPDNGTLVYSFDSAGGLLPAIIIPPGTSGVNALVQGDPGDPVVVQDNGTATFSVGYRIDEHNNPPTQSCNLGLTPAECCPPATNTNAFPTTDTNGLSTPNDNWLFCRFGCGLLACPGGWYRFSQLGANTPSGDWNIRVNYTPFDCLPGSGACCFIDGSCDIELDNDCISQGGLYQGDGVACFEVTCPQPEGACCVPTVGCSDGVADTDCTNAGGTWLGAGTTCTADNCPAACCLPDGTCVEPLSGADCQAQMGAYQGPTSMCAGLMCPEPTGACCIPATGGCLAQTEANCIAVLAGIWQGPNTDCAQIICFPIGACCLPDGSCLDNLSPGDCTTANGVFQGDMSTCGGVTCPQPTGACCIVQTGGCLVLNANDCTTAGGSWAGAGTDCSDNDGTPGADDCAPDCPEDINGDNNVGFADLNAVLSAWGPCPAPCPEDQDDDGNVGFTDLNAILTAWGPC